MARGNEIVLSNDPRGRYIEGFVTGTPKPGIVMQVDIDVALREGRHTWEPWNGAYDSQQSLICILLNDTLQGKTFDKAYATGERIFMYCPIAGEEMNILLEDVSGTADDHAVGDRFIVDDSTGKFLATTGTSHDKSEPFFAMEAITDPVADTLIWAMYTGH